VTEIIRNSSVFAGSILELGLDLGLRVGLTVLSLLASPLTVFAEPAQDWTQVDDSDGIRVWKREIPGQQLPGFRGEVIMATSVEALVAVLKDYAGHTEWMHRCVASAQLKDLGGGRSIDYNRTDAPWPVWDRDAVVDAQWSETPDRQLVTLSFKNANPGLHPLPKRTVRLPKLVGFYQLWRLGTNRTKVVYQVEADPGGSLPTWLAKSVVRDMPYNTLSALRARTERKHEGH
jgi:hypothetical protein